VTTLYAAGIVEGWGEVVTELEIAGHHSMNASTQVDMQLIVNLYLAFSVCD